MSKLRQDAWSEEDDLLLAETVLRHVREGSTQLHAFEEVGDKLERTSAAVGFRWNAIVRKRYEQALKIAKKQRKERQRSLAKQQQKPRHVHETVPPPVVQPAPSSQPMFGGEMVPSRLLDDEVYNPDEFFKTAYTAHSSSSMEEPAPVYETPSGSSEQSSVTSLDEVISFLENLKHNGLSSGKAAAENSELKLQLIELKQENRTLRDQVLLLEKEYKTIQEDYQALIQIMDRARKMVLLQDETDPANQSFRMDKNGNLERVAK
ncbi:RsfA family transcriptional regulator [Fictibacillus aquaticus]|uniref:RsfA family transcriptional regulator n=1 Tax=Fictibacillus aquaticus TaxID=2021314 RepID=A0A235F9U7_9BACL|nr:RsfA family transcriptional regulator [Fictibacillus aquaticus]OYD58032.1 RsfA family transcriptional regulator [Fictibacillus aquaticus]